MRGMQRVLCAVAYPETAAGRSRFHLSERRPTVRAVAPSKGCRVQCGVMVQNKGGDGGEGCWRGLAWPVAIRSVGGVVT